MHPRCRNIGIVDMDKFAQIYNQMSDEDNILTKASTVEFLKDSNGCQMYADKECKLPLVTGFIFYDYKKLDNRTLDKDGKVVQELKIDGGLM